MARRGRPTVEIDLSAEERSVLERWARRQSSSQALALRSKIVLACAAEEATQEEIAAQLGCHPVTVGKWRQRFFMIVSTGSPTPLVPVRPAGSATTWWRRSWSRRSNRPPDATHWSTRSLAAKHG